MSESRPAPRWVGRTVVLGIHADQIRQHGGSPGLRDAGILESALERPRNRWHYEPDADPAGLAAAYGFGTARDHPLLDGNERVAFKAMYVEIEAPEPEVVAIVLRVADGILGEAGLADWLRGVMVPSG